jgi:hypothetical protein
MYIKAWDLCLLKEPSHSRQREFKVEETNPYPRLYYKKRFGGLFDVR